MDVKNKYVKEQELLEDMRQSYSLLFIAINKLQSEVDASLGNLTSRQLMLLTAIAHCEPTEATIVNISTMLGATKQNVTRMVKTLCAKGMLVNVASEKDKRSVNIQLTELGRSLLAENIPKGNAYFLKIFEKFTPDEIAAFRHYLEKLSDYDDSHQMHLENSLKTHVEVDREEMEGVYMELRKKMEKR